MGMVNQEIALGLHVLSKIKALMMPVHKIVNITLVGIIIEADLGLLIVRIRNINPIEILDQDPEIDIKIAAMSLNVMISNVIPNMMKDIENIISTTIKEVVVITKIIKVKRKVKSFDELVLICHVIIKYKENIALIYSDPIY